MSTQLLIVALLMFVFSILVIYWPRKASEQVTQTRTELFRERMELLVLARDHGELAPDDFNQAATELKNHFLDSETQAAQLQAKNSSKMLPFAVVLVFLITAVSYGLTGHYRALDDWAMAKQNLASYGERALLNQGEPLTDEEISLFALALRTKIANEGDDAVAWFVLGRLWFSQGFATEAIEAFERALRLTPERTNVLLSYAQALLVTDDAENLQKAAKSIGTILAKEPNNTDALAMLALLAQQRGDIKEATAAWELLLSQMTPDDPRYAMIQQQLAGISTEQGAGTESAVANGAGVAANSVVAANAAVAANSANDTSKAEASAAGRSIAIELTIPSELATRFADAALFVVARAPSGSPMPLAVQKFPVQAGTLQIELTSAMVMQAGWGLDNVEEVVVSARISQSGAVTKTAGDPEVQSELITFKNGQRLTVKMELTSETTD